jgi:hypothetical protein
MEAPEVPTEQLHEEINHHAEHSNNGWERGVALSSAFLAALAAICSLLAGHHANEALIEQIQSSDKWAYYQAKGIKSAVLESKIELLQEEGHTISKSDTSKLAEYKKQQDTISEEAKKSQEESEQHLTHHMGFAAGVTFFQIAIVIGAISVLSKRRNFWYLSLLLGIIGLGFFIKGYFF